MQSNNMLFLLSHQPNPRFVKQIRFLSVNNNISVVHYHREYMQDLSCEYEDFCILNENIGSISNGNYFRRIGSYFKSIKELKIILSRNRYDILIVNNIDTLILFKVSNIFKKVNIKIIIEISDLRAHTYSIGIKAKLLRISERLVFKYVDKLIVTSPKFYDMYYDKILGNNQYFLLENKPLSTLLPKRFEKIKNDKIVIGIVGLLLQGKPYETLFETIKNNDKYEVHIYGKGIYEKLVKNYSDKYENIKYFGEYNFFQDSAQLYSSIDILYMPYDTKNGSLNNKVALPNKLYEAMYFQIPIITSSGTYLGELVKGYKIGLTVKCCDSENLLEVLNNMNNINFMKNFDEIEHGHYLADNDYIQLENFIKEN